MSNETDKQKISVISDKTPMCDDNQQLQWMKGTKWTPVTIPPELTEKLKSYGKRLIKIEQPVLGQPKSGKAAFEKKFYDHPYAADDPELLSWLAEGGNYGILAGDGLALIDMDIEALQNKFEAVVNTFTTQSGRISSVGKHAFVTTDAKENGSINATPEDGGKEENLGRRQSGTN